MEGNPTSGETDSLPWVSGRRPQPSPLRSRASTPASWRSKSAGTALRAGLDLILDQRGAEMADVPGGDSGLLVRDYKSKEADRLVARIAPGEPI